MRELFLDTNVIVDFVMRRPSFYAGASALFSLGYGGQVVLHASALSFANAAYIMRNAYSIAEIRRITRSAQSVISVVPLSDTHLTAAFDEASPFTDIEDGMQHDSALEAGAQVIITRDIGDFAAASLPVMTPTQFLAQRAASA